MRALLDKDPRRLIIWLAVINGVLSGLAWLGAVRISYPTYQYYHTTLSIFLSLIIGALLGVFYLYFGGWLYKLTGSWLGGKGSFIDVKCAIGWSNYPLIIINMINFFTLLAYQILWLEILFAIINIILPIWAFVIFLNLIGEAHRFSAWKALLAVFITLVLIFVAIMLVSLLVPLLAPIFK